MQTAKTWELIDEGKNQSLYCCADEDGTSTHLKSHEVQCSMHNEKTKSTIVLIMGVEAAANNNDYCILNHKRTCFWSQIFRCFSQGSSVIRRWMKYSAVSHRNSWIWSASSNKKRSKSMLFLLSCYFYSWGRNWRYICVLFAVQKIMLLECIKRSIIDRQSAAGLNPSVVTTLNSFKSLENSMRGPDPHSICLLSIWRKVPTIGTGNE